MGLNFPISILKVADISMEPAIRDGDYVFVNRMSKIFRDGEVVVLKHPKSGMRLIKRIRGIKDNRFFVVGDNTDNSEDSRSFGAVDVSNVIGKVLLKV
ncbi:MAG: nickel-type superoxide dismutase maturation protease [Candidatus Marsarchaeota archaeon]|nr:nickel-type superoxide dismutase maturation protease [Candidatus Marsarchaeota archaeon]